MEFTTAHLQFVKSIAHFLARTTINNFNQPFKTEFNKSFPHFDGIRNIFIPKLLVRLNINLYYVKIQRNIARATMKIEDFQNP